MRNYIAAAPFLLMMPTVAISSQGFKSGNQLLAMCESVPGEGICLGYVIGIVDVMQNNSINGYVACFPSDITSGQAEDVVIKRLKDHPEDRHLLADGLVAEALSIAF